jgi:hypothetical protein
MTARHRTLKEKICFYQRRHACYVDMLSQWELLDDMRGWIAGGG